VIIIIENVTTILVKRDFSEFIFIRSRILTAIKVTATIGEIGLKLEEKAANETLLNTHPSRAIPAIKITRERYVSFLFIIWENVDFKVFMIVLSSTFNLTGEKPFYNNAPEMI
jgi:hypothetical protein